MPVRACEYIFRGVVSFLALSPIFPLCARAGEMAEALALERAFVEVAQKVSPAVVSVVITEGPERPETTGRQELPLEEKLRRFFGERPGYGYRLRGLGSGVIFDPAGYILTNEHVVGRAEEVHVILATNERLPAKVLGKDKRHDLAVLKVEPKSPLPAAKFADFSTVRKGQFAIAIGNPFGLAKDLDPTMTVGHVSALGRSIAAPEGDFELTNLIQTDASINPGNSGGPLVNIHGEVIGINTAIFSTTGGSIGIGFAVPMDAANLALIEELKKGGAREYGWLGIEQSQALTPELAAYYKLKPRTGLLVSRLVPGGPAERAGLKVGDVITSVDGKSVTTPRALAEIIESSPIGQVVELAVLREGKQMILRATVAPKRFEPQPIHVSPKSWRGLHVKELTKAAVDELGLKEMRGALIHQVEPGSPADKAGLRPGLVIDRVRDTDVLSAEGFRKIVESIRPNEDVLLRTNEGMVVVEGSREPPPERQAVR